MANDPDKQIMNSAGELVDDNTENPRTWDVCVTTYEIANMEKKTLQRFAWKYLVIDEAVCYGRALFWCHLFFGRDRLIVFLPA